MKTETDALRNYSLVYRLIAYDFGSLAPLGFALTLFVPVLVINLLTVDSGQYQILAESLISGRLDFMAPGRPSGDPRHAVYVPWLVHSGPLQSCRMLPDLLSMRQARTAI